MVAAGGADHRVGVDARHLSGGVRARLVPPLNLLLGGMALDLRCGVSLWKGICLRIGWRDMDRVDSRSDVTAV